MKKWVVLSALFFSMAIKCQESPYKLKNDPDRPRTFIFPPLISTILPGFDQYVEGQSSYGFGYTGTAVVGYGIQMGFSNYSDYDLDTQNDNARMYQLGGEFTKIAGGLSAFHSFRTAVKSRKNDFLFLTAAEESPKDILLSPFNFSFLSRPTTYWGISGILVLDVILGSLLYKDEGDSNNNNGWHFKGTDVLFAGALSAGAGISEESFFRGWMMPTTNYYVKTPWVSNLITAVIFGAAHLGGGNSLPLPQAIAGYYFGWVAQRNGWGIGESVFIHTWVDVFAFLVGYATGPGENKDHTFYLPLTFSF
jgi:membrane protease YdiL (CAAX protease family)